MAAPTYSEDLTDLTLCEATTGFSALGGGGAGLGVGVDFAIQGTNALDKQVTGTTTKGAVWDNGSTITMGANDHVFAWIFAATPGILTSLATGGKRLTIGTSTSDYNDYYVDGNDSQPEGGNKCYVARYTTSTPSPGAQTGTPGANPQWFGGQLSTAGTSKGINLGLDAIRYGSGAFITAGDGTTPATFAGFATQNDNSSNRWGLLSLIGGIYQWQGKFVVGQNNAGTPTAAHFDDSSGATVTITDTPHSLTDFTELIIDHASTVFNLTGATFIGLGTNNPGKVTINNASASSTGFDSCTFRSMGTFEGHANVDYIDCNWVTCGIITQSGGTFTGGTIDSATGAHAIESDNLSLLTNINFISDGTGHAVRYRPTGAGPFTVNWDGHTDSGYAATDGSTGNETLLIDPVTASANVTVTVANGADTPTIMEAAGYTGTFTLVEGLVSFTLTNVVSGSRFHAAAKFTTSTVGATWNGTGDSTVRLTVTIPSTMPTSGNVRLWNGTFYDIYAYTGVSGTDLTGISPTLSQDYGSAVALIEDFIAPTLISVDPYTVNVQANQDFEAILANASGTPKYEPILIVDNTGSGFARRVSQIED